MARTGSVGPDGSMHLLGAVANRPEVAGLVDHPATFGCVWSTLGWNIHLYPPARVPMPFRFGWHQDGGRQNREIETTARRCRGPGRDHAWGHDPAATPLYRWPEERGFLDPANRPLRP